MLLLPVPHQLQEFKPVREINNKGGKSFDAFEIVVRNCSCELPRRQKFFYHHSPAFSVRRLSYMLFKRSVQKTNGTLTFTQADPGSSRLHVFRVQQTDPFFRISRG